MLDPISDRLSYGKLLSPPYGYEMTAAIGTTYSVNLDALVGAFIPMVFSEQMKKDFLKDPINVHRALNKASKKVVLFFEAGQISKPPEMRTAYSLLENSLFQIALNEREGRLPSFHPKFWIIKFENKNEPVPVYRIIVLSKNLTLDRSWDICVTLDGIKSDQPNSKPIIDFLEYLKTHIDDPQSEKKEMVSRIIKEISELRFEANEKGLSNCDFIPIGIRDDLDLLEELNLRDGAKYSELLLISPFLSESVVNRFNSRIKNNCNSATIITRQEAIDRIEASNYSRFKEIFVLNSNLSSINDELNGSDAKPQEIHAKLYLLRQGGKNLLYLGSMNATESAFRGNVEFLFSSELNKKPSQIRDLILREGYEGKPFQLAYLGDIKTDTEKKDPMTAIRRFCRSGVYATASKETKKNKYCIEIYVPEDPLRNRNLMIKPMMSETAKEKNINGSVIFRNLEIIELSQFYIITSKTDRESVSKVIKIPTEGIPKERDDVIIRSIINSDEDFMRYVEFILFDSPLRTSANVESSLRGKGKQNHHGTSFFSLYENMLVTAAREPKKFIDLFELVESLGINHDAVPDGFIELMNKFREAINQ